MSGAPGAPESRGRDGAAVTAGEAVVARIPYLNMEPFYAAWGELPGATRDLVPRRLGEEARAGRVDAGPMAVADWFDLEEEFDRLGPFGIACRGAVESVLLYARRPLEGLGGARIRLTSESSTSVRLARLLLERRQALGGLRFERADLPAPGDAPGPAEGEAWLLIGDAALAWRRHDPSGVVLDLGEAWTAWTGLPFVYAVWTARRSLPAETREGLQRFLDASLARGEHRLEERAAAYAAARADRLGDGPALARYLERFRYRLGPEEEAGLAAFRQLVEEFDRVP